MFQFSRVEGDAQKISNLLSGNDKAALNLGAAPFLLEYSLRERHP